MFCFIKKSHEIKEGDPLSYFFRKKHYEHKAKILYVHVNTYISKKDVYEINKKGPKMIWVPKVKT